MKITSTLLACILGTAAAPAATLVGLWEFNNEANLAQATVGSDLGVTGTPTGVAGPNVGDGAASVAVGTWFTVTNPISANGASGTPARTNQFTVVIDFQVPTLNGFNALLDFDGGSDADYFIRKSAGNPELGVSATGYVGAAGTITAGTWYRLVYAVNNGVGRSTYLNGTLVGNHAGNNTIDYSRSSIGLLFDLFHDLPSDAGENEKAPVNVTNVALYDGALTAQEVSALGAVGSTVPEPSVALLGAVGALGLLRRRR